MKKHIKRIINHAKDQSAPVKKQIAFMSSLFIVFIIVLIWIFTFNMSNNRKENIEQIENQKGPFSVIADIFKDLKFNVGDVINLNQ